MSILSILTFLFIAWLLALWQLREKFYVLKEKTRHAIILAVTLLFTSFLTEAVMIHFEDLWWKRTIVYVISFFAFVTLNIYLVHKVEKQK
jgi:predicted neutral ceramidase superfamily lipid hydrolase